MRVTVAGIDIAIGDVQIISGASIEIASGSFHGIVGPNGCGKSTLLRCIYRSLKPLAGNILFDDADLWQTLNTKSAARRRSVVSQDHVGDLDFSVREVVAMGRTPHKGIFDRDTAGDTEIIDGALHDVGMEWAATRILTTLSGGERQRVLLARALAQQAPILVLDEPTNHLDVRAQVELLELVRSLGMTTITALHDLDQAASICDAITVMQKGTVVATGPPLDVLTPERVADVFGVAAHIGVHPLTGRTQISVATLAREHRPKPPAPDVHQPDTEI